MKPYTKTELIFRFFLAQSIGNGLVFSVIMFVFDLVRKDIDKLTVYLSYFLGVGTLMGLYFTISSIIQLKRLGVKELSLEALNERLRATFQLTNTLESIYDVFSNKEFGIIKDFKLKLADNSLKFTPLSRTGKAGYAFKMNIVSENTGSFEYELSIDREAHVFLSEYIKEIKDFDRLKISISTLLKE